MFTIASAKNLLTHKGCRLFADGSFLGGHGGIKVYCTGNPNNVRKYSVETFLRGSSPVIRSIDCLETGRSYWGKHKKTCMIFVDGDSALVEHAREELLVQISSLDHKCNEVHGTDLLMGTVYVKGNKDNIHQYPVSKYQKMFYVPYRDCFTIRKFYGWGDPAKRGRQNVVERHRQYKLRDRGIY